MTNHRSNLLNQHTWMAQSKRSVFANCTGWECVSVIHTGREVRGEKKNESYPEQAEPEGDSLPRMYDYIPTGSSKTD